MIAAAAYNCEALLDQDEFDRVYNLISPQRQSHVDAANNRITKCQRLGASHLLEKLLWENHFERPYEYDFTSQGKPILTNPTGLYFSLSHTEMIAVAVISDEPCGIDIEAVRDYKENIANRFFTKNDIAMLESCELKKRPKMFTEIWTYKEAMCKMLDRPLPQVMQWIDFHVGVDGQKGDMRWVKQGFEFRYYYITICHQSERKPINMGFYELSEGKYY